ncbi:hypothetical protein [Novosphingobium sp.]|uniref:hypothetical protein n=1 Tax=Novosphingobium sp. TaxID=1874826 RepID=UPI002FDE8841
MTGLFRHGAARRHQLRVPRPRTPAVKGAPVLRTLFVHPLQSIAEPQDWLNESISTGLSNDFSHVMGKSNQLFRSSSSIMVKNHQHSGLF